MPKNKVFGQAEGEENVLLGYLIRMEQWTAVDTTECIL